MKPTNHWLTPDWPAPANIHAATTLRNGGGSTGAFTSLNPAYHVGDDPEAVKKNREIIHNTLNLPSEPVWLEQIHSNLAIDASKAKNKPQADASFTDRPNVVCAVMTADCLPLLICTKDGQHIAAIHAGWRGLHAGIINATLSELPTTDVMVWLGPAIGPEAFEVGRDVYDAFVNKSGGFASAFQKRGEDKWLANIYHLARIELNGLGINKIYGGQFCTYNEPERFFSYRRDHKTGRMLSLIWRE